MNGQELEKKLIAAYDKMIIRVGSVMDLAEEKVLVVLQQSINKAKVQAIELK